MQILVFIFYFLLFSFIISRIPFFKKSGLGLWPLLILFAIKIAAGVAYAKFYTLPKYYEGSDTWRFYRLSLDETRWLRNNPVTFMKDLFIHGYGETGNLFSGENTYWNDLKSNVVVKIMAVMNILTGNSYYTNIILFNFLFLFGLVALFKLFRHLFASRKIVIISLVFLLPSTLFWCSGIHKDGLILSATGIVIYCLYQLIEQSFQVKKLVLILLASLFVFSLRNYVVFALVPSLIAWLLSVKYPGKSIAIFAGVYITGIAIFFIVPIVIPSLNFPLFVTGKREEFLLLEGGSEVKNRPLTTTFSSFIAFLPIALDMAFLRPHLTEVKNVSYLPAAIEVILLLISILVAIFNIKKTGKVRPVILFLLTFSLSIMLLTGYTIPFTGAILRYRSFVLPLLITPLLGMTNIAIFSKKTSF